MKNILFRSTLLLSLVVCFGCGQPKIHKEFKNLTPVSIVVTDGTQPLKGVSVTLSRRTSQGAYACTVLTNHEGIAQIRSIRNSYSVNGIPAGKYSVVLFKVVELPPEYWRFLPLSVHAQATNWTPHSSSQSHHHSSCLQQH